MHLDESSPNASPVHDTAGIVGASCVANIGLQKIGTIFTKVSASTDIYELELEHRDPALQTKFRFTLTGLAPAFADAFEFLRKECAR